MVKQQFCYVKAYVSLFPRVFSRSFARALQFLTTRAFSYVLAPLHPLFPRVFAPLRPLLPRVLAVSPGNGSVLYTVLETKPTWAEKYLQARVLFSMGV